MARKLLILFIVAGLSIYSCQRVELKPDWVSEIPYITDFNVIGNQFRFTDTSSVVDVVFKLWDEDADIGNPGNNEESVTIEDVRSDTVYRTLKLPIPDIPRDLLKVRYLEADIKIPLKGVLFTPRTDTPHLFQRKDTLILRVYVHDEAGHQSNIVESGPIYITE